MAPNQIATLVSARASIKLDLSAIFTDELGQFLVGEYRHQCNLLSTETDATKMDARSGYLGQDYFMRYFRQSITRVYHLVTALRKLGMDTGTLLEIGSLFGTFSGTLQKLGYKVTAVDRYSNFCGALDGYINDLRSVGVDVIEADADNESEIIDRLPQFDIVINMAVVEHIPHTPRYFLELLSATFALEGFLH